MGKEGKQKNNACFRIYKKRPKPLPINQLPLNMDVDLAVEHAKVHEGLKQAHAIKNVSQKVLDIYQAAGIPTINPIKVTQKIKSLVEKRRAKGKNIATDKRSGKVRDQGKYIQKGKNNQYAKLKLVDVVSELFEVKKEIPESKTEFYEDQMTKRRLFIDKIQSESFAEEEANIENIEVGDESDKNEVDDGNNDDEDLSEIDVKNTSKEESSDEEERELKRKYIKEETKKRKISEVEDNKKSDETLNNLFEICDRFNVSETATSHIHNVFVKKRKLNQSQVHKKKKKLRIKKVVQFQKNKVTAIGFDERKDLTKKEVGVGKNGCKRFDLVKEEHCAIVLWPGGEFAGHVVPKGGKAVDLAIGINDFIDEREKIDTKETNTFLSDGCEKLLGWRTGVHASLEKIKGRRYQRGVCFFHHLELSFEKIIKLYGVYTTSPDHFIAPWDQFLTGNIHLSLVDSMGEDTLKDLGTDHRIFIGLLRIILTGEDNQQYSSMKIGPVVHSRFTTTETRFLRRWISTETPSFEQLRITRYLVYVWAETFLTAKIKNRFEDGSRLLLLELLLSKKHCSMPEFTVVKASMDYNGQYAHHESILVSLLSSPKAEERKLAVDTIFSIREQGPKQYNTPSGQRPFKREDHKLNEFATKIENLNMKPLSSESTEPPMTLHLNGPKLLALVDEPLQVNLPVMTVAVERAVKEVTRAATMSSNPQERDGIVLQTISARSRNPYSNRNRVLGGKGTVEE